MFDPREPWTHVITLKFEGVCWVAKAHSDDATYVWQGFTPMDALGGLLSYVHREMARAEAVR